MNKQILRLAIGCSLSVVYGLSFAQAQHSGGGGSGNSGTHSSGGGGYSGGTGSHSTGGFGNGGRSDGGYHSGGNGSSGGYRSGGGYQSGGGRYSGSSSRYGQTGGSSRYQGGGTTGSRYQGGAGSGSRYQGGGYSGGRTGGSYSGTRSNGYSGSYYSGSRVNGERGQSGPSGDFSRGHADLSRSGANHYDSNNNRNGSERVAPEQARFGAAPHGLIRPDGLGKVIGDRHGGLWHGGYRTGYYGYWGGWRDSFFAFPFYVFDPWIGPCYVSPWWYYPCLPAYVAAPNVIIVDSYPSTNWSGSDYEWDPGAGDSHNQVLDDSIQDLVQAFESDDQKAIDRVVPHSGNVNIYADGKYSYSLKANDFYDTYVDGIESTKTDRYEILEVKAGKDGNSARVTAKHVYNDPWGNRTYVYHSYFLVREGDEYVIREFGTSDYHAGW